VSSAHKSRLVVLDFDHTIIPADSDELVLAKFSGGLASARARLEKAGREGRWAITFAEELEHLQLNEGVSLGDIREVLKGIKIGPHLKYAMEACSAFSNTDLRIVSDANTWFIKTVLEANGLHNAVSQIVSNIACFKTSSHEDALQRREFLRIEPFHKTPHPKTLHSSSPANLCKGRVMREWLKDGDFELVIYCGDGAGDFEGAMAVPANGLILARSGWALYERLIDAAMQGRGPEAQVLTWDSHMQLGNTLASLCHVPTLREVQGAKGLRAQGQLSSRSPPVPEY
jgi:2,3-diketo-5-methylthio-1-phosphopentane phosphatase